MNHLYLGFLTYDSSIWVIYEIFKILYLYRSQIIIFLNVQNLSRANFINKGVIILNICIKIKIGIRFNAADIRA